MALGLHSLCHQKGLPLLLHEKRGSLRATEMNKNQKIRMMRKILLGAVVVIGAMMGMTGCKMVSGGGSSDSLLTDSVKFQQADSLLSCVVSADVPTGTDSMAIGVRTFINAMLDSMSLATAFSGTPAPAYSGDLTDGQAMVRYYGQQGADSLRAMDHTYTVAPYSYTASVRKVADTPRYVTYSTESYSFLGGAHGSAMSFTYNILKPSGRVLTATVDTAQVMKMQPLLAQGVADYISVQGQKVTAKEVLGLLFIDNGIIPLPKCTPYLTPTGLCFIYQQYEIGPYAMGMITFTLPYGKVKPYMTPEALRLVGDAQ